MCKVTDDSKTGKRDVPLSGEAIRLLKQMDSVKDGHTVFQLTEAQVDALFRKLKKMAEVEGFTFHDTKHLACTRLAQKISVFDLARMVGTRDLRTLMIYYNASATDIAKKLD
jgi:integrase